LTGLFFLSEVVEFERRKEFYLATYLWGVEFCAKLYRKKFVTTDGKKRKKKYSNKKNIVFS